MKGSAHTNVLFHLYASIMTYIRQEHSSNPLQRHEHEVHVQELFGYVVAYNYYPRRAWAAAGIVVGWFVYV